MKELMRGRVRIFLITQVLIKTMSIKFHALYAQSFGDLTKDRPFSKLDSRFPKMLFYLLQ